MKICRTMRPMVCSPPGIVTTRSIVVILTYVRIIPGVPPPTSLRPDRAGNPALRAESGDCPRAVSPVQPFYGVGGVSLPLDDGSAQPHRALARPRWDVRRHLGLGGALVSGLDEIGIQSRCDRACSPVALALGQGVTQLQGIDGAGSRWRRRGCRTGRNGGGRDECERPGPCAGCQRA